MQFDQRTAPAPGDPGFRLERVSDDKQPLHPLNEFMLFLTKYACKDNVPRNTTGTVPLWKEGKTVTVDKNERISSVLTKFIVEGFQGAPVVDEYRKYCGFVEMLDIVWYVVRLFSRRRAAARTATGLSDFFAKERKFEQSRVEDVMMMEMMNDEPRRSIQPVNGDLSLFSVLEIFARSGARRLPVIDDWQNVVGIITQSMMISLISQNLKLLGDICDVRVRTFQDDLQFTVQSVEQTTLAIDSFESMVNRNISGLGVVDRNGFLIDAISTRDLRVIGFTAEKFSRLWETVGDFKKHERDEFPTQTPVRPIVCTPNDTLGRVVEMMDDGNIHRVFVVESLDRPIPIHVVSQIDVIRIVLSRYQQIQSTLRVRPRIF